MGYDNAFSSLYYVYYWWKNPFFSFDLLWPLLAFADLCWPLLAQFGLDWIFWAKIGFSSKRVHKSGPFPLFKYQKPFPNQILNFSSVCVGSNLINVQSQIRAYGWEKTWKLINVRRTFIWHPRVQRIPGQTVLQNIDSF